MSALDLRPYEQALKDARESLAVKGKQIEPPFALGRLNFSSGGAFSKVFEVDEKVALKVYVQDEGYTKFLEFVEGFQWNPKYEYFQYMRPLLPKIYYRERVGTSGIVLMERLYDPEYSENIKDHLAGIRLLCGDLQYYNVPHEALSRVARLYTGVFDILEWYTHSKNLGRLSQALLYEAVEKDLTFDLHGSNYMLRKEVNDLGVTTITPVVIDPWARPLIRETAVGAS
jgi:hypothetical protein